MDSRTAVVARQTYVANKGIEDEWAHPMPALGGEIVIRTVTADWYVGVTDEGNLKVRVVEPGGSPRMVVVPDSANFLTIEAREMGKW